jgi:5,10-methylenetetrahydromethanopterin reductase
MRIGVVVEAKDLDSAVAGVRQAADEGFASAWFTQMFSFDAITVCTVAGREVPGIELGTAVVPTYPRHPVALAMQAMTASSASGGRFALGIGLSHQMVIEGMLGLSYDKPARHMREYLETLVPLLHDGKVDHDGAVFKVHAPVDGMGATPPPVLVAALGPAMLRVTGELADGTITWMTGPKTLADHIVPSLTKAAAGRPAPRIVAALRTCVSDSPDEARERIGKSVAFYGSLPSYRAMLDREGVAEPGDVSIVGDEDHVAGVVRGLADIGVSDFVAVPAGTPEEIARTRALLLSL